MMLAQEFALGIFATAILGGLFVVWSMLDTWRKLPEACAAWDVGTMLVCFMERNEGRWPKNWEELASSIKPDDECVFCRGADDVDDRRNGYPKTIERIRSMVRIDREYVPNLGKCVTQLRAFLENALRLFGPAQNRMKWFTIGLPIEQKELIKWP